MELQNIIQNLIDICYPKQDYIVKINQLFEYMNTEYLIKQKEIENKLKKYETDRFCDKSEYIISILNSILQYNKKIENKIDIIENITLQDEILINEFICLIYQYLIDQLSFDRITQDLCFLCHEINYKKFSLLTKESCYAICEIYYSGVSSNYLEGLGNSQILFLNQFIKGKYTREQATFMNEITKTIDQLYITKEMKSIEFHNQTFLLEYNQSDNMIYIYHENDYEYPFVIINQYNQYKKGQEEYLLSIIEQIEIDTEEDDLLSILYKIINERI